MHSRAGAHLGAGPAGPPSLKDPRISCGHKVLGICERLDRVGPTLRHVHFPVWSYLISNGLVHPKTFSRIVSEICQKRILAAYITCSSIFGRRLKRILRTLRAHRVPTVLLGPSAYDASSISIRPYGGTELFLTALHIPDDDTTRIRTLSAAKRKCTFIRLYTQIGMILKSQIRAQFYNAANPLRETG